MTEVLPSLTQPFLGRSAFDSMPDHADHPWRQQYFDTMPPISAQWAHSQAPQLSGMQEIDLRMFQHDAPSYAPSYHNGVAPIQPHGIVYSHDYLSDMENGSPSTTGYAGETADSFSNAHSQGSSYLQPPYQIHRNSAPTSSPHLSHAGISPRQSPLHSPPQMHVDERPPIGPRSITAPEPRDRRSTASSNTSPAMKRAGTSSDDDGDYVPAQDVKAPRNGRKRHRIPHTAVERRYRENLNAHLDKLRQTVPALASRKGPGGGKDGEGVKPSKCEILNGAIEHIGAADKENAALRNEVQRLRSKLQEVENWYRTNSR